MLTILDLDDDCLINIFEYLSILELIAAEKVCQAFKSTCENVYAGKKFQKVRFELRTLKTEFLKDIFDRIGETMRSFEFSGGYIMDQNVKQAIIDGISSNCIKLENLSINYVTLSRAQLDQLQDCFSNLTSLDLSRCDICESSLDNFELDGERLEKIKVLKLAGNSSMTGSFFKNMKSIETLDVSYCFNLNLFEFQKFLENCKKLVDLNVSGSCQLIPEDQNFLQILFNHQPYLERLNMDYTGVDRDSEVLMKFKRLKVATFEGRKFGT